MGGLAGAAGIVVGHPLDTLRVRYQTENMHAIQILRDTWRHESLRGFYKGMASPLASCFFFNAVLFYSSSLTRSYLEQRGWNLYPQILMGGLVGGVACAVVTSPTELVKIKTQIVRDTRTQPFNGSISCAAYLWRTRGPLSLTRGMTATVIRDVPGYIAYFWVYQVCKELFIGDTEAKIWEQTAPQLTGQLAAGAIAGVAGWLPGYPFEVIKTRIQAEQYDTIRDAIRGSIRKDGPRVFVRGLGLTLVRAVPVNATVFLVYETLMDLLDHWSTKPNPAPF